MTLRKHNVIFTALLAALMLFSCGETTLPENTDIITTEISVPEYPIESILFPTGKENFSDVNISTVQNLYVAEDNPSYVSVDGVIFTKDLKTLVAFPAGRAGEYTIPDGTETIGIAAFRNCSIDSIYLPDSVSTIRDKAFSGCMQLKELSLPQTVSAEGEVLPHSTITPEYPISGLILRVRDGNPGIPDPSGKLQKIFKELSEIERVEYGTWVDGTNGTAFIERNRFGFSGYEGTDEVYMTYSAAYLVEGGNVYVPNGYMKPQEGDFRLTKRPVYAWTFPMDTSVETICSYNAAPENVRENLLFLHVEESLHGRFVSIDGVVFTKDRKTLVAFPAGRTGHYTVPDGVEHIGEYAFLYTMLDGISIPSSIKSIHENAFAERWTPTKSDPVLSFALSKEDTERLMKNVYGTFEYTYRDVKKITAADVTVTPVKGSSSKWMYTAFLLKVGEFEKTIEAESDASSEPTVYVEDLTGDEYPEIIIIYTAGKGTEVHWSGAIVLDGITLEEYEVEPVWATLGNYIQFKADEEAFYIVYPSTVSHKIERSRFGAARENQFDRVVTENYYHYSVSSGKLHCSVACQFTITEFCGTLEVDLAFDGGKFVYENSEYVTE